METAGADCTVPGSGWAGGESGPACGSVQEEASARSWPFFQVLGTQARGSGGKDEGRTKMGNFLLWFVSESSLQDLGY